jgi:glycosyltransferase involved in cell wall biosynthesis
VAIKNPNWHWVLIGKIGEGQPQTSVDDLANIKNIHILGPKSYEILPSYIRHFDIATIPCPKNQYTESMFPMKFFEYMAAGKPIIVRDIDSLLEFKNNYYSYSSEEEFIDNVSSLLNLKYEYQSGLELAKKNTWEIRLKHMLNSILEKRS